MLHQVLDNFQVEINEFLESFRENLLYEDHMVLKKGAFA